MVELFNDLTNVGLDPNPRTYVILMNAYQCMGMHQSAIEAFSAAANSGNTSMIAKNLLVDILVDAKDLTGASGVLDELVEQTKTTAQAQMVLPAFGALAAALAAAGKCQECVGVLRRFMQIGGTPDRLLFEDVLQACIKCGQVCSHVVLLCVEADVL